MTRLASLLVALVALAACTPAPGPRRVRLAEHVDDPREALRSVEGWGRSRGLTLTLEDDGRVFVSAPATSWERVDGGWHGADPVRRPAGAQIRGEVRLTRGGDAFEARGASTRESGLTGLSSGQFRTEDDGLWLCAEELPPDLVYGVGIDPDRRVGRRARVELEEFSGDGFHLWSGLSREVRCDVPPGSTLDLFAAASPFLEADAGGAARLRVTVDGRTLLDAELPLVVEGERLRRFSVPVPDGVSGDATLRFGLEGPPALGAVLAPTLRPAEVGSYGDRPWPESKPDLVLFLADTFRADNMAAYGGELDLTPTLDALAEESLLFARSWSPAPWTIPSQASMLAAHVPPRLEPDGETNALGQSMVTVAEQLGRAGYRTGAVTDGVFVSRTSGFHQGFELFDERLRTLDETQAAVDRFLDQDDGRPVLLFVQTYRVHLPYHVTDATRAKHAERLGIVGDFDSASTHHHTADPDDREDMIRKLEERAELLQALYRGGVIDLDRWFGGFVASLRGRGVLPAGTLLFTSDHGEAFYEHGMLWHVGGLWEELIRVPLFLHGGGAAPGRVDHAASVTDVGHTLCELAGVAPRPEWDGTSLLSLDRDRRLLAFERGIAPTGDVAVIDGSRKLLAPADPDRLARGEPTHAFDLDADPGELRNLVGSEEWPDELAREAAARTRRLLELQEEILSRRGESGATATLPERADRLEELGYVEVE